MTSLYDALEWFLNLGYFNYFSYGEVEGGLESPHRQV